MMRDTPSIYFLFEYKTPTALMMISTILLVMGLKQRGILFMFPREEAFSLKVILAWIVWQINQVIRITMFVFVPVWLMARSGILIQELLHEVCEPSPTNDCYPYWLIGTYISTLYSGAILGSLLYREWPTVLQLWEYLYPVQQNAHVDDSSSSDDLSASSVTSIWDDGLSSLPDDIDSFLSSQPN